MEWIKGSIAPDLTSFIAQMIATILLLVIFAYFFWKPLKEFAAKRRAYIKAQYDDVENLKRESENFILDAEAKKNEIYSQSNELVAKAKKEGEKIKSKAIEDAKFEANRKIERADQEIREAKENAKEELILKSAEIAELIAHKLIVNQASTEDQSKLIDEALGEI